MKRRMRILIAAPQPFFQERGTPIAVRLLAETLCEFGHEVDLLVYHAGSDLSIRGLRLIRAARPPGIGNVPIGISWQKIVCDIFLVARMFVLVTRNKYDVVHAVEETIFPAALFNAFSRRKLVYDMDSSLADQLTDSWRVLKPLRKFLVLIERMTVRRSTAVLAVCEDLAAKVRPWVGEGRVTVLPDVPLDGAGAAVPADSLRAIAGPNALIGLYVGNLEHYQGIDLLVDGVARLSRKDVHTFVIGGDPAHVERYRQRAADLGIADRLHFLGTRPIAHLSAYLAQADILLSPRTLGTNTPMKVYSYMQSGKAILATDIRSHTQALDSTSAELVAMEPRAFAAGLERLAADPELRHRLGATAQAKADREYSLPVFRQKLRTAYERVAAA
jgi:glycosyltransferase involved in cell wall biosynthesis